MTAMMECVPNVSEGHDPAVISALADAIEPAGARFVDVHSDVDHHRSVFTFLGPPAAVEQAALALARAAVRLIDLRRHRGVHPRIGAIDVVPFVPLAGSSMAEAVRVARRMGAAFAEETGVPVFFYGGAATRRGRRELPEVRRGGFEELGERMRHPEWHPDAGPAGPHPTAGATVVGARGPLIAFNAVLDTPDAEVARAIARAIREASGGLPAVRAMGVFLESRTLAQVSMNLLDYRRTPVRAVGGRLEEEARRRGLRVLEYELVGCAPADAFAGWPAELAPVTGLKESQLLDSGLFPSSVG
jgi:glutamate formiminotransferase